MPEAITHSGTERNKEMENMEETLGYIEDIMR